MNETISTVEFISEQNELREIARGLCNAVSLYYDRKEHGVPTEIRELIGEEGLAVSTWGGLVQCFKAAQQRLKKLLEVWEKRIGGFLKQRRAKMAVLKGMTAIPKAANTPMSELTRILPSDYYQKIAKPLDLPENQDELEVFIRHLDSTVTKPHEEERKYQENPLFAMCTAIVNCAAIRVGIDLSEVQRVVANCAIGNGFYYDEEKPDASYDLHAVKQCLLASSETMLVKGKAISMSVYASSRLSSHFVEYSEAKAFSEDILEPLGMLLDVLEAGWSERKKDLKVLERLSHAVAEGEYQDMGKVEELADDAFGAFAAPRTGNFFHDMGRLVEIMRTQFNLEITCEKKRDLEKLAKAFAMLVEVIPAWCFGLGTLVQGVMLLDESIARQCKYYKPLVFLCESVPLEMVNFAKMVFSRLPAGSHIRFDLKRLIITNAIDENEGGFVSSRSGVCVFINAQRIVDAVTGKKTMTRSPHGSFDHVVDKELSGFGKFLVTICHEMSHAFDYNNVGRKEDDEGKYMLRQQEIRARVLSTLAIADRQNAALLTWGRQLFVKVVQELKKKKIVI